MNKNINIKKLLNISSCKKCSNSVNNTTKYIKDIVKGNKSIFAFESALHFFNDEERNRITKILSKQDLYDEECFYFAEDIFGNLFCEKGNRYFLLDIEGGDYEYIVNGLDNWAKYILEEYNYFTGYLLAKKWQNKNRSLLNSERLVPKKNFVIQFQS